MEWEIAAANGPITVDAELEPRAELVNPALEWLGSLDEKSFEREFNGSPVRRAGFLGLRRNVAIAMGNSGRPGFATVLEEWATAADEGLRVAARWALGKLRKEDDGSESLVKSVAAFERCGASRHCSGFGNYP